MATPRSQRIGIWIIAIVLTVGTLGSFLALILGNQNSSADQAKVQKASVEYQKLYAEYDAKLKVREEKVAIQAKQLSDQYYDDFNQYSSRIATFKSSDVKKLSTKDIIVGDGETLNTKSSYSAYYINWGPSGKSYDQSIDTTKKQLKSPLTASDKSQMIDGWKQGVLGMKVNGVREITIPSNMAYDATGSSDGSIPPNTPLKFIVMIIPKVEEIPQIQIPQMPQILIDYYKTQQRAQQ